MYEYFRNMLIIVLCKIKKKNESITFVELKIIF